MSKLIIHARLGRLRNGLMLNEEIMYKKSLDSVRIIDTFYIKGTHRQKCKSYIRDFS